MVWGKAAPVVLDDECRDRQSGSHPGGGGNLLTISSPWADKKEILVPLTNSLYVKGNLSSPDKVLVDIGTGFYVEKVSEPPMILVRRFR